MVHAKIVSPIPRRLVMEGAVPKLKCAQGGRRFLGVAYALIVLTTRSGELMVNHVFLFSVQP